MATVQITVTLDEAQLGAIDSLIAEGEFASRSDALRSGVATLIPLPCLAVDDAIRSGYEGRPPTAGEIDAAHAALRDAIDEEAW